MKEHMVIRDEKDRPFWGPTRTGFGADFELVQTADSDRTGPLVVRPSRTGRTGPKNRTESA